MNYEEFLAKKIERGEQDLKAGRLFSADDVVQFVVKETFKRDKQLKRDNFQGLVAV